MGLCSGITFVEAENGFSLVEFLVVIGIVVVGLLLAIPAYNMMIKPTVDLNTATRLLYSEIQLARLHAVNNNVRYGLAFYGEPDRYVIFVDSNENNKHDEGDNDIKTVDVSGESTSVRYDTTRGGEDGISFANHAFGFKPQGLATNGGSVFLTNSKNEGREISVTLTGVARIIEY